MAPGKETGFAPPCPNLRSSGSKCRPIVLKKVLVTLLWLSGPPAVIRRPRNRAPLPTSLRLWCYAMKIGEFFENKQIFKPANVTNFYSMNICNCVIPHGSCTDCQQRLLAPLKVSSCSIGVTSMLAPRVFSAWTCVCFANNKTFPIFNKLLLNFWRQLLLRKRPRKPG